MILNKDAAVRKPKNSNAFQVCRQINLTVGPMAAARLLAIAFTLLFSSLAFAQGGAGDRHRVSVQVDCTDASLRGKLQSFILRELRDLRDVDIVEKDPEYKIVIIAVPVSLTTGRSVGYAHSVVITDFSIKSFRWLIADEGSRGVFDESRSRHGVLESHELYLAGDEDLLRKNLAAIVARFDMEILEPSRKVRRLIRSKALR